MTATQRRVPVPRGERVDIALKAIGAMENMLRLVNAQLADEAAADESSAAPVLRLMRTAIDLSGVASWALGDEMNSPEHLTTMLHRLCGMAPDNFSIIDEGGGVRP